jgi:hypothetical protein
MKGGLVRLGKVRVFRDRTLVEIGGVEFAGWEEHPAQVHRQVVQFDHDSR